MNKIIIYLLFIIAGGFSFISCSDWTEVESVDIEQQKNPDYKKYLENIKAYKNSDHKHVYAWFDNSNKAPYSRGQHMSDVPDSIDVVVLMHPDSLANFEIQDMETLQKDKGTKVIYTVDYDAIKKVYDQMVKDETDKNANYTAPEFISYLQGKVDVLLNLSSTYNYNGIVIGYSGQSTVYMSTEEKAVYVANQTAFFNKITTWYNNNQSKMIIFKGSPQFLIDKSLLTSCKHIILNTLSANAANELSVQAVMAKGENIPSDRFIVIANTVSLDSSDKKTGYYGNDRAIIEAGYWVTEEVNGYTKAGLGIYNVQNDYYNASKTYQYVKQSINIMNPAPTN